MSEYCLRWNNHRPNLVTVFSELLNSEALVDVTLATDGHYIHAHKLVLSACSVYFKDLFGANPCKHPIVILKDIRIEDLKTVIDFIYRGEVNVAQDRLQDVLRTAESLRIKGLAENPRGYDELSSHGTRFLASQAGRQRSSLTDSREQSLSLEGEDESEPVTPPSNKRRKITALHDSSESVQEEGESEERSGSREVKDEPPDDQDTDKPSREGSEQDTASVGGSQESVGGVGGDESAGPPTSNTSAGTSATETHPASTTPTHTQGLGEWSLQQLSPWWASVLPALTRHHHHHHPQPPPPTTHHHHHRPHYRPPPLHHSMAHLPTVRSMAGKGTHSNSNKVTDTTSNRDTNRDPNSSPSPRTTPRLPLDHMSLVAALGKEVSPQMVQALQAVAARRESFSSAAKLYAVSVTTLWRYSKKLGLSEPAHK